MTNRRRIFLNVIATYGRSSFQLICGLFTARWILLALGVVDFGLYGVIGGMVMMVAFLNNLMASAVGRFYAYYVGAAYGNEENGVEECRKWFNTALSLHIVVPVFLLVIGYPIGCWAIRHYLVIPPDKISACIWVWRFVCAGCFSGMITVPFYAMYVAKQDIAELTIYAVGATALNVVGLYYMARHPGPWLVKYAFWTALITITPQFMISLRSFYKYAECRIVPRYMFDRIRMKEIAIFAGGRFVNALSQMMSTSGEAVLVNRILGPVQNAAMTVGNSVAIHGNTFSSGLMGAFSPAITNAAGAGNFFVMRKYINYTCILCSFASMVVALPLILELKTVTKIWLVTPPNGCVALCFWLLISNVVEMMAAGLWIGIFALGRIVAFQTVEAFAFALVLPISYFFLTCGCGIAGVGIAFVLCRILGDGVKVYFAQKECHVSVGSWMTGVAIPSIFVCSVSVLPGICLILCLPAGVYRVVITTFVVDVTLFLFAWRFLIPAELRKLLVDKILVLRRNACVWRAK